MAIFDESKFEKLREETEDFYKTIGEIYSPYFQEKIIFNAKGLEHLKFGRKNHARLRTDQFVRFKLLVLAPDIIKLSKTIQGISHTKSFEIERSNQKTKEVLKPVSYYEFVAILDSKRVRVVIKQVEEGPKYFWSIIPFWRIDKNCNKRRYHYGNPELD